ncbi:putative oxidoreductase [Xylariomycetidae sp. FL0641]|nr:putative oxidoreductase [Xylariomycetidae sp. FL0641]
MPHQEAAAGAAEFAPERYPPFPASLPTVALPTIPLAALLDPTSAAHASARAGVLAACGAAGGGRGFFYLDLRGDSGAGATLLGGAELLARAGAAFFTGMPEREKQAFALAGTRLDVGYKRAGATVADAARGTRDTAEFLNVGKDEVLAAEAAGRRRWPPQVAEHRAGFAAFARAAHAVGLAVLAVLEDDDGLGLGLPPGAFAARHRLGRRSGDHVRIARGPPRQRPEDEALEIQTPSHTDFGTITILMNWLGGLQVWSEPARRAALARHEPDDSAGGTWEWVRPEAGCALVNLGDAAVRFSAGALCAGRHRVVPAPGAQGAFPRYSVVYFVRPEDDCVMRPLMGSGARGQDGGGEEEDEEEGGITAKEWIHRQALGLGLKFEEEKEDGEKEEGEKESG